MIPAIRKGWCGCGHCRKSRGKHSCLLGPSWMRLIFVPGSWVSTDSSERQRGDNGGGFHGRHEHLGPSLNPSETILEHGRRLIRPSAVIWPPVRRPVARPRRLAEAVSAATARAARRGGAVSTCLLQHPDSASGWMLPYEKDEARPSDHVRNKLTLQFPFQSLWINVEVSMSCSQPRCPSPNTLDQASVPRRALVLIGCHWSLSPFASSRLLPVGRIRSDDRISKRWVASRSTASQLSSYVFPTAQ